MFRKWTDFSLLSQEFFLSDSYIVSRALKMCLGCNHLNLYVCVHFHCVEAPDSEFPGQEAPSLTVTVFFCFLPSYKYTILNFGLNTTQK